jgi:hypothetical protein
MSTPQAKSNVQSLIDFSINTMLHQMKGIGNGKQDERCLLPKTWKSLHECNNKVNCME